MTQCRETSGILFRQPCSAEAVAACFNCQRPVCGRHARQVPQGFACVTCMRSELEHPDRRGSYAHLRDDPYFYWYYTRSPWHSHPYDQDDFALFDRSRSGPLDNVTEDDWAGS